MIFAAKTTASALIALLVAFTFNLDQPQWALLTVFIVAQPQSGLVLAKSFYRIIGTLLGAVVALLLVALFAQERVLFLGALALWIGLCTFGSASTNARPARTARSASSSLRPRVTEIHQHAVAHVLGDEAVEAARRLRDPAGDRRRSNRAALRRSASLATKCVAAVRLAAGNVAAEAPGDEPLASSAAIASSRAAVVA
jgi:hypothetical protein